MMDPRKILFTMSEPSLLPDDPKCKGLACKGCIFQRQRASVCIVAGEEAVKRGLSDCDKPDLEGKYIVYIKVAVDPRQGDLLALRNNWWN